MWVTSWQSLTLNPALIKWSRPYSCLASHFPSNLNQPTTAANLWNLKQHDFPPPPPPSPFSPSYLFPWPARARSRGRLITKHPHWTANASTSPKIIYNRHHNEENIKANRKIRLMPASYGRRRLRFRVKSHQIGPIFNQYRIINALWRCHAAVSTKFSSYILDHTIIELSIVQLIALNCRPAWSDEASVSHSATRKRIFNIVFRDSWGRINNNRRRRRRRRRWRRTRSSWMTD